MAAVRGAGGVVSRLYRAEAEGAAIVEIQRLDADLAEAIGAANQRRDEQGLERQKAQHARAVQALISALPAWESATLIQQTFRRFQVRKASTVAAQREAEARAKAAEDARAAERDTEEDKAIIANLCNRKDLHYPTAAEVREALKMARGTKARMPEVVRVLRRKAAGAPATARSAYNSPVRSKKRARAAGPMDANLPLSVAFLLHRERARAAPGSPPSTPPSPTGRDHSAGQVADNRDLRQLQRQIAELRAESDAQAQKADALAAQLSQANGQLSQMRVQLSEAKLAAHSVSTPYSPAAAPRRDAPASTSAEWDSAASKIQTQAMRWRHMQDMRALMDATKREAHNLKATLADRNSQIQAYTSRIKILEANNAQLVSQGGTQIASIEALQEELQVLQDWQRSQHEFVAEQQTLQEEVVLGLRAQHDEHLEAVRAQHDEQMVTLGAQHAQRLQAQAEQLEFLRAQHAEQLHAQAEAHAGAVEEADSTHTSALEVLQSELDVAAQQSQELALAHERQVRELKDEMQEQARESRTSEENQDRSLQELALRTDNLLERHNDVKRRHEEAMAVHAAEISTHQVSYAQLQLEHDHQRTLVGAHKEEVAKMGISLESAKRAHAATHIQMEYQRMRFQQDSREIQRKQRSKFEQLSEQHVLISNEHAAAQQHIHHNASTSIQLQFYRKQAQHDMRKLLSAHRAQIQTQDATATILREQLVAAEAELVQAKERLHSSHRDALNELRAEHDEYVGNLRDEHEQSMNKQLGEMRCEHTLALDENAARAAKTAADAASRIREAAQEHQSSMADLKRRFEAETAPLTQLHTLETEVREAATKSDALLSENRNELRELGEQLSKWKELAIAQSARVQAADESSIATVATDMAKEPDEAVPPEPALEPEPEPEPEPQLELEPEPEPQLEPHRSIVEDTPRRNEPTTEEAAAQQARLDSLPEVQVARAKVVFTRYDADADGFLNLRELREMMAETKPGQYMTQEQYETLCKSLMCDQASGVSLEKFVRLYQPPLAETLDYDITNDFAVVAGTWIFELYDGDSNGFLNFIEANKLQMDTVPGEPEITEFQFEKLCKMLGCNPSQGIDVHTFVTAYCPPRSHQLGWDIAKDFALVAGQNIAAQYDTDALGIVVPGAATGSIANLQAQVEAEAGMARIRRLERELDGTQQRITQALVLRDAAIRERDAAARERRAAFRETKAAEEVVLMTAQKLKAAESKQIDPALFDELAKWRSLAEQAHQQQPYNSEAAAEMDAWITFAQSFADETVRTMNYLVVESAQVRAGPKLASPPIGRLAAGEIVRVIKTVEIAETEKRGDCVGDVTDVLRGQIMTTNFPDGWVSIRTRERDGDGKELTLLKRIWPAATVSPRELQQQFDAESVDEDVRSAVIGAVDATTNRTRRKYGGSSSDGSNTTGEQVKAALGLANGVVASAQAVRSEVEDLQIKLGSVESERDQLQRALETAETVESTAVLEAVDAMEKAQVATTRCRDRVAELQQVVDEKDRAIDDHRQARQRLEEEMAEVLNDVTRDARTVEKLDADYRIALAAAQNAAELAIDRAKNEAKGVAMGAQAAIAMLAATMQDGQDQRRQPPAVSRLNLDVSSTGSTASSVSPAIMPQLPVSPPTTVDPGVTGSGDVEAQHVRSLQLRDELEIGNDAKQQHHSFAAPPSQGTHHSAPANATASDPSTIPGVVRVQFAQPIGPLGISWQEMILPTGGDSDGSHPLRGLTIEDRSVAVITSLKPGLPASQGMYQGPRLSLRLGLAAIEGGIPGSPTHKQIDVLSLSFKDTITAIRVSPRPVTMLLFPTDDMRLSLAPSASLPTLAHEASPIAVNFQQPGPLGLRLVPAVADQPNQSGVKLQSIKPDSPAKRQHVGVLVPGCQLVSLQDHSANVTLSLRERSYREVIQRLKGAGRPLTLYFVPLSSRRAQPQPSGRPPAVSSKTSTATTAPTRDVTITQSGAIGIVWKSIGVGSNASSHRFPMVKMVQAGSVAEKAGMQPFEVLSVLNGRPMASTPYEQAINTMRSTRPLHLSFLAEKAALKATVTFVRSGPLGLQLEPTTGNPRAAGVKLKSVKPTSAHANTPSLLPGMRLVAVQDGDARNRKQVTELAYGEVVSLLKVAGRPITLTFQV